MAFKKGLKKGSAIRDLGCSIEFLKKFLESQFQPGMSWSNLGLKNKDENGFYWEIDHIVPFYEVDLNNREELLKVCHYSNLRSAWGWANLARNGRPDSEIDFSSPTPKYFEYTNCEEKNSNIRIL